MGSGPHHGRSPPGLTGRASAWRALLVATGGAQARFVNDLIFTRRGCTEISPTVVAPVNLAGSAKALGARLTARLYDRAKS